MTDQLTPAEELALVEALEREARIGAIEMAPHAILCSKAAQVLRDRMPRPMGEAPRDGTEILVENSAGGREIVDFRSVGFDVGWFGESRLAAPDHAFSRWWPLPPLPET